MTTNRSPLVSIIIPCREPDEQVRDCVQRCLALDYDNLEVLVVADAAAESAVPGAKVISAGVSRPSRKRNIGTRHARGEYFAFIDADAFPAESWVCNALRYIEDGVGAVGGPALTPENSSLSQKAGGEILSSPFGGGRMAFRYTVKRAKECSELPSCNLVIRKSAFEEVGGYDEDLLTSEDAKLCFQIREMGLKVLYAPDVVVFHHRRSLMKPHLAQIWNYGRDKAFLFKTRPTFASPFYFIPAAFIIWIIAGFVASFFSEVFRYFYIGSILLYLAMALLAGLSTRGSMKLRLLVFLGVILTHFTYGAAFLIGLGQKRANRQ